MGSRVDNTVNIIAKVIKGPYASLVGDKKRARYQVEIQARKKEKGQTFMPFVISRGNQAESDLQRLKPGDLVAINGRIITRYSKETRYFLIKDNKLQEVELADLKDDDTFYEIEDKQLRTEILAEDVNYITDSLVSLPVEKLKSMVSPKRLEEILTRIEENKNIVNKESTEFDD